MPRRALSLRRLLGVASGALLALALVVSAAPVLITRELGRNADELTRTLEGLGATEEVEVALLLHERERRLLQATGDPEHERRARQALTELQRWHTRLPDANTSAQHSASR